MRRITIRDIAKLVGVNPSTVSRALKDHPDIGKEVKQKIQEVARELGYRPNYQAINFRQRKSKLIGLILPELGRFFFPDMIRAIEEMTRKNGYNVIILQSNDQLEKEQECLTFCQNFGVDGVLICLTRDTKTTQNFANFLAADIPIVYLDRTLREPGDTTVSINDFQAAHTAIQYLAGRRYQRIAGLFAGENLQTTQLRKQGFQAALEKYDLPRYEGYSCHANSLTESKAAFLELLKKEPRPDAIFTMSDELLISVTQTMYELNLRIPEDMAVISISNGYLPYYIQPRITFIKHSGYAVGQTAAGLLLDLINGDEQVKTETMGKQVEVETYLVELESC
ncbi:MAG: LacI family DNA-binding transcriptional regulator [Saprospiraceae bacterium]